MSRKKEKQSSFLLTSAMPGLVLLAAMWLVAILSSINIVEPGSWGVFPRSFHGLLGIVTAPMVHGGFGHLLANSAPFFFLLTAVFFFYRKAAWDVLIGGWFLTGLWVWIGARDSSHLGASGLVYCFAGFLFFSGIFRREVGAMALSLIVVFIYGGLVWGVLPVQAGVSWESHLYGGLAGIFLAYFLRNQGRAEKKKYSWDDEPDDVPEDENAYWKFKQEQVSGSEDLE